MSSKIQVHSDENEGTKQRKQKVIANTLEQQTRKKALSLPLGTQAGADPRLLKSADMLRLQRTVGNQAVRRLMAERGITPRSRGNWNLISRVALQKGKLNVVGEFHSESDKNRDKEENIATRDVGGFYKGESDFEFHPLRGIQFEGIAEITEHQAMADPLIYRVAHRETFLIAEGEKLASLLDPIDKWEKPPTQEDISTVVESVKKLSNHISQIQKHIDRVSSEPQEKDLLEEAEVDIFNQLASNGAEIVTGPLREILISVTASRDSKFDQEAKTKMQNGIQKLQISVATIINLTKQLGLGTREDIKKSRDLAMHNAARQRSAEPGVWKIGNAHAQSMKDTARWKKPYHLMTRDDFYEDTNYKKELGN